MLTCLLAACGGGDGRRYTTPRVERDGLGLVSAKDPQGFAQAINAFGLDVWEGLRTSGHDGNLALSPASIAVALGMVYAGARTETASEIAFALHVSSGPDETGEGAGALLRGWNDPERTTYTLAVVNRLFAERSYRIHPDYLALTRELFEAELERLDFRGEPEAARGAINEWVELQTRRRIRELLPAGAIGRYTRAVIVNAVYFYGRWQREFDPERTEDRPFHLATGDDVDVPTMGATGGAYGEDAGVKLVELPYVGGELAMLIALPNGRAGLSELEPRLDAALIARWRSRVQEAPELELTLPRFRIESEALALADVLRALGIRRAFGDGADFGGIAPPDGQPLKLDEAYHRAFVEVDEKGTEAAAATAFAAGISQSLEPPPPYFHADHPFLFFIVQRETGAILFAGRVTDPSR